MTLFKSVWKSSGTALIQSVKSPWKSCHFGVTPLWIEPRSHQLTLTSINLSQYRGSLQLILNPATSPMRPHWPPSSSSQQPTMPLITGSESQQQRKVSKNPTVYFLKLKMYFLGLISVKKNKKKNGDPDTPYDGDNAAGTAVNSLLRCHPQQLHWGLLLQGRVIRLLTSLTLKSVHHTLGPMSIMKAK